MLRGKADVTARDLEMITAEMNIRVMHLRRFLEGVDFDPTSDLPVLDVEQYGAPDRIAATVRAHWGAPSGPIKNLTQLVERAGVVVGISKFGGASVSGATFRVLGKPPLVFAECRPARRQNALYACARTRPFGHAPVSDRRHGNRRALGLRSRSVNAARRFFSDLATKGRRNMMKHAMTRADRTKIIEALKNNPNAAAVARQFGFGETTILRLCKKEGIGLQHLLTKAERAEVLEMLKTNLSALATAKQLGINHKTVLAIAKKERIDIKGMRQASKGRKTLPFTQWSRGPGGKPVLQCVVYLSDGSTARPKGRRNHSRLSPSLNTSNPDLAAQRMRLILWQAIADKRLVRGVKHPAWLLYGGPIPRSTKRLLRRLAALPWADYELQRKEAARRLGYPASTIDWLTNQDKARQADPVRRARVHTLARSRARKVGKLTPMSRSWQFSAVGGMLAVHLDGGPIYAQLTIAGFTLRWGLAARNRAEGETIVKPAVDARARVREAARHWRACPSGSPEAKTALAALLGEQRRFRDALMAVGAKGSKGWAEVVKALKEPPFDEARRQDPGGCTQWFVDLLVKNPGKPPRPLEATRDGSGLLKEAATRFSVSLRRARRCYELAQEKTQNRNWRSGGRPETRAA
jgi:hypothetical protein